MKSRKAQLDCVRSPFVSCSGRGDLRSPVYRPVQWGAARLVGGGTMQPGFPDETNGVQKTTSLGQAGLGPTGLGQAGQEGIGTASRGAADSALQQRLIDRLGLRHYDALRRNEVVFQWNGDELLVHAPQSFLMDVLQSRHRSTLNQLAQELRGESGRVRFQELIRAGVEGLADAGTTSEAGVALERTAAGESGRPLPTRLSSANPAIPGPSAAKPIQGGRTHSRTAVDGVTTEDGGGTIPLSRGAEGNADRPAVHRRFSRLSEFVAGSGGQIALAAASHFVSAESQPGQGLYVFGPTGVGKTHLLEGITDAFRRSPQPPQVLLLTAEQFTNQFTSALRVQGLPAFRQRFRTVDVLLVDDVDFLDGKMRVQEEFLHTLQQIESSGHRFVLAGDRHPRMLSRTRPELVTRFLAGITCRIELPDTRTREEIVARKARGMGMLLPPEAARIIARARCSSVREIEGALCNLRNLQRATGGPLSTALARQVVGLLERDCVRVVRLPDIERVVCETFGVTVDDLRSNRRTRGLSEPRMLAMFLARRHTRAAYSEIGRYFGGRNHATVISAEKKIQSALESGAPMRVALDSWPLTDLVQSLEQQLQAS